MAQRWEGWMTLDGVVWPYQSNSVEEAAALHVVDNTIMGYASPVNYTLGAIAYAGAIGFPLAPGNIATLLNFAITQRDTSKTLVIDNGVRAYTYNEAYASELRLSANWGEITDATLNVACRGSDSNNGLRAVGAHVAHPNNITSSFDPYAWRATTVTLTGATFTEPTGTGVTSAEVISWEVTIDNGTISQGTFDGNRVVKYIQQGPMKVSGSITVYNPTGVGIPVQTDPAVITLVITDGITPYTLTFPVVVFNAYNDASGNKTEKTTRKLDWTSLADGTGNEGVYVS